jgi:nucleotide-binding universal stress UspA family protein
VFEKIVIASEISRDEFNMIKRLKDLQKLGTKECLLLQCLSPHERVTKISSFAADVFEVNLKKQKKILTEQGFEVETRIVPGIMKNEINRIAVEENFSIIVAGIAEQSMIGELFFGGAAHEVIYQANKPVLLIRVSGSPGEAPGSEKAGNLTDHILHPTDFSDNARIAFEYVKEMVAKGIKQVTLVHVQDPSRIEPKLSLRLKVFNEIDEKRLLDLKNELTDKGNVEVDVHLLHGSPSAELLRLIRNLNISLVVMGSQGRGFIKEIYLGSVSHNIARHSSASVLLIPAKRD